MPIDTLTPIHALVDQTITTSYLDPVERDELLHAVYIYCLKLKDSRCITKTMDFLGYDEVDRKDLKEALKYSLYAAGHFWRAVYQHLRGDRRSDVCEKFSIDPIDLDNALELIDADEYMELLQKASYKSTYSVGQERIDWVIENASPTCRTVANRKLRWISRYDPSFDAYSELLTEAIRVANHYAHFPDKERILAYVKKSVYHRASYLSTYHSSEERRRAEKLPEFRCNTCHEEYRHRSDTMSHKDFDDTPASKQDRYCPSCAKGGRAVRLFHIEGERVYRAKTLSIDTPVESHDGEGRPLSAVIPDTSPGAEHHIRQQEFLDTITRKLSKMAQRFVHILVDSDEEFESWLREKKIQAVNDPLTMAHLICGFLGVEYEDVKDEVGRIMGKPVPYVVQVDGEESERDIVFARSAQEAVMYVAHKYKYPGIPQMKRDCGDIRVTRYHEATVSPSIGVQEGTVIPVM